MEMSEFTWYSRLAVWIGCAMLLAQSVVGRDAGPVSVLAVLLVVVGLICFLTGLASESRVQAGAVPGETASSEPREPTSAHAVAKKQREEPTRTPAPVQSRRPKFRERTAPRRDVPPPSTAEDASRLANQPGTDTSEFGAKEDRETPGATLHVRTRVLDGASSALGDSCPRCGQALAVGQHAATCPVCGTVHHAICWMEHDFRCSTRDCAGEGSLEAAR